MTDDLKPFLPIPIPDAIQPDLSKLGTPLKAKRKEQVAQGITSGKSQAQSYLDAGYVASDQGASKVSNEAKVQARMDELLDMRDKLEGFSARLTPDMMIAELFKLVAGAKQESVKLKAIATLLDHLLDPTKKHDVTTISNDDLIAQLCKQGLPASYIRDKASMLGVSKQHVDSVLTKANSEPLTIGNDS